MITGETGQEKCDAKLMGDEKWHSGDAQNENKRIMWGVREQPSHIEPCSYDADGSWRDENGPGENCLESYAIAHLRLDK